MGATRAWRDPRWDPQAKLEARDWAEWNAEHGGNLDKSKYRPRTGGRWIHKSDAAAIMFGAGSQKHHEAIKKWGQGDISPSDKRAGQALSVTDPLHDDSTTGGFKIGDSVYAKDDKERRFPGKVWGVTGGKVNVQFRGKGRQVCSPSDLVHSSEPIQAVAGKSGNPYDRLDGAPMETRAGGYVPAPYDADGEGKDEPVTCPHCGKGDARDARFCDQCGTKLEGRDDVKVNRSDSGLETRDWAKWDADHRDALEAFHTKMWKYDNGKDHEDYPHSNPYERGKEDARDAVLNDLHPSKGPHERIDAHMEAMRTGGYKPHAELAENPDYQRGIAKAHSTLDELGISRGVKANRADDDLETRKAWGRDLKAGYGNLGPHIEKAFHEYSQKAQPKTRFDVSDKRDVEAHLHRAAAHAHLGDKAVADKDPRAAASHYATARRHLDDALASHPRSNMHPNKVTGAVRHIHGVIADNGYDRPGF